MSTPTYDGLLIQQFEEHWDDEVACAECDQRATTRVLHLCCMKLNPKLRCDLHYKALLDYIDESLADGYITECSLCGFHSIAPTTSADLAKAVTL